MQDRYAFDQGDFSKVGLMRWLAETGELRCGLLWHANQPSVREAMNGDGRHHEYLRQAKRFEACDAELHRAWARCFGAVPRNIASLEAHTPWPPGMRFFGEVVPPGRVAREAWFGRARRALKSCDLVFCDPDNGIARAAMDAAARPSMKHVLPREIHALLDAGQSLVLYHHLDRSAPHDAQARRLARHWERERPDLALVSALRYRRGSSRLYLLLAQPGHAAALARRLGSLKESAWCAGGHFTVDA